MASISATSEPTTSNEAYRHLTIFLRSGNSLGILVTGKTGVGKSSLINNIYPHGAKVAAEGDSVTPVTEFVVSYSWSFDTPFPGLDEEGDVKTTVTTWDTPGFGDIFADEERKRKLHEELGFVADKADVLLYCCDIRTRMTPDDVDGIVKITQAAGIDVWRKAVFVLTFANKYEVSPDKPDANVLENYKHKLQDWNNVIRQVLSRHARVLDDIVQDISVVPVGYRGYSPPDREDWYLDFWTELFKKTREPGKPALLRISLSRLNYSEDRVPKDEFNKTDMTDKLVNLSIEKQPSQNPSQNEDQGQSFELPPGSDHQRSPTHSVCSSDSGQPCPSPVGNVPRPLVPRNQDTKTSKKILQAGSTIGSVSASGAVVGLLIGIAGGPFGMGIGAAAGLVVGAGAGVAGVIANAVKEHIERTRQ